MNQNERILAIREGGQTKRCHTMQYIGEYNIAVHSYNALSLLLLLYPGIPSIQLIRAVMWHDIPERWTGDIPTPAKLASPSLRHALENLELYILDKLKLDNLFSDLDEREKQWLAGVDILELFIWAREQEQYGNSTVSEMNKQILTIINKKADKLPKQILEFVVNFEWSRSPECNNLSENSND